MKKLSIVAIAMMVMVSASAQVGAALIAGWDFQNTASGGTAVATSPATPKVYIANVGSGTMYLDGSNGSSNWFVPGTGSTNTELNGFSGTAINAGSELSAVATSPAALAFVGGLQSPGPVFAANGKRGVIRLSLAGYQNLSISYASQRTTTGFTSQTWEWSTDGTTYNPIGTKNSGVNPGDIRDTFLNTGVLSFSGITGLDNAPNAYVRVTFNGATNSTGNNRIDNLRFEAQPIPEPSALVLLGMAASGATLVRRRQQHSSDTNRRDLPIG